MCEVCDEFPKNDRDVRYVECYGICFDCRTDEVREIEAFHYPM